MGKFFAPWCGHCKSMAADWEKLGEKYNPGGAVSIAEVDCTQEDTLCGKFSVQGFPTIKYFLAENPGKAEDYNGGRTYDDLDKFTEEKLAPKCTFADQEKCSEKEKQYLAKMKAKGVPACTAEATRLGKMLEGKMKADSRAWASTRQRLAESIAAAADEGDL